VRLGRAGTVQRGEGARHDPGRAGSRWVCTSEEEKVDDLWWIVGESQRGRGRVAQRAHGVHALGLLRALGTHISVTAGCSKV
jgi:hypothetical protein